MAGQQKNGGTVGWWYCSCQHSPDGGVTRDQSLLSGAVAGVGVTYDHHHQKGRSVVVLTAGTTLSPAVALAPVAGTAVTCDPMYLERWAVGL